MFIGSKIYISLLIVFLTLLVTPVDAFPKDPRIERLIINSDSETLHISFSLKDGFSEDIENAMLSGIPVTFTFFIEIYKNKNLWPDEMLTSLVFKHVSKYDTLKEEFEIFQEENPQNYIYLKELDKVKEVMTIGKDIPVIPIFILSGDGSYRLRIKAEMDTIKRPFPLNYLLFFTSFWDFETPWLEKRFNIEK
ncbi:MAG: DUF4390 domain-containing protein [Thermodesulfobacteriota bacterium]